MTDKEARKQIRALVEQENPQLLTSLDATKRNQVLDTIGRLMHREVSVSHAEFRSGPLPSPEEMIRYNDAAPNLADRIVRMVEKQQDHRMEMESLVITSQQKQGAFGQIIGAGLVVLLIAAGCFTAYIGAQGVAGTIFATTILGVAGLYGIGKVVQKKDLQRKNK